MTIKPVILFIFALGLSGCEVPSNGRMSVMDPARFDEIGLKTRLAQPLLPVFCQNVGDRAARPGSYRVRSLNSGTLEVSTLIPGRPVSSAELRISAVSADLIAAATKPIRSEGVGVAQALMIEAREREGRRNATLWVSFQQDGDPSPTTIIFPLACLDGA